MQVFGDLDKRVTPNAVTQLIKNACDIQFSIQVLCDFDIKELESSQGSIPRGMIKWLWHDVIM